MTSKGRDRSARPALEIANLGWRCSKVKTRPKKWLIAHLPAVLALLAGCTGKPHAADPQQVMAAIQREEEAQSAALVSKDFDAAMNMFAPDATLYTPGLAPAVGRDAIKVVMERVLQDPALTVSIDESSRKVWVAASGDLATTTYRSVWTHTDARSGKVITEPLVSQTTWQKQADGRWKSVSDMSAIIPAAQADK